jgi:pyruvate dehydrogenase E1 component subunit alpha
MSGASGIVPLPYSADDVAHVVGSEWRATLLAAYRWMTFGRTLDARMVGLQRQGRVGFYGAATGQEAVAVAAGLASLPEDWIVPGLREQLIALVRGHDLTTYVHHLFADSLDPAQGRNMPCHPTAREVHYVSMSSVIGTQISHAVGLAWGLRFHREKAAALAFFGDGATSANDFHAGLNFAGVFGLPVLFCCTNNQWAISEPVERQTAVPTLAEKSRAYGFGGARVDGTDFVAAFGALQAALSRVRAAAGPEMIEFVVYRMTPHSTSDDPSRYQPKDWIARAQAQDPLGRLERWMVDQGVLSEATIPQIAEEADARIRAAIQVAEATPPPPPESLVEGVYAEVEAPSSPAVP